MFHYVDPLDNHCHLCGMMSSVDDVTDLVNILLVCISCTYNRLGVMLGNACKDMEWTVMT